MTHCTALGLCTKERNKSPNLNENKNENVNVIIGTLFNALQPAEGALLHRIEETIPEFLKLVLADNLFSTKIVSDEENIEFG